MSFTGGTATFPEGGGEAPATQDQQAPGGYPVGTVAAKETGTPQGSADGPEAKVAPGTYGPNNEKLPEEFKSALFRLITDFKNENPVSRQNEVKRIRKAREFWRGLQYLWWDDNDQLWHLPFEDRATDKTENDVPRFMYVSNYHQAYGLSIIAVLSQDVPKTRFWPSNAETDEDQAYAKAATSAAEFIERNNRLGTQAQDLAFELWSGGKVGAYVRYVIDGQRFGFHPEDDTEETQVKLGEDAYLCHNCGAEAPASSFWGVCPECGTDLDEENFSPAPTVSVPIVKETLQIPNGQEVISYHGGLELTTPSWANYQYQYPYLIWDIEAHVAEIRAAYPAVRDKIGTTTTGQGQTDTYERQTRIQITTGGQVTQPGDINKNLISYRRAWIRPWTFEMMEDKKIRAGLYAIFPRGAYVAFSGTVYCESRNESMDDHWRVMHALPGDGQDRNALGTSHISIQERINTLDNIVIEQAEHGIPITYAFTSVLDFDALPNAEVEPGAFYPVTPGSVAKLQDGIYTTTPVQVSEQSIQHRTELAGETSQFLTAAFPALFGGNTGSNDTAAGISIQRNQAMGRIGLVWRRMKFFQADVMTLAVDVFRKNRPEDVQMTVLGPGGQFESKWIRVADMKGNIFGYPETDEQYPTTWSEQRAVLLQLIQSPDPLIQQVLSHPENLAVIKRLIGIEDLVVPDEQARQKEFREIAEMLQGQPVETAEPQMNPQTGQAVMQPTLMPSVMPDPQVDNNEAAAEADQDWLNSDAGQAAKTENPMGYANVRAHFLIHKQAAVAEIAGAMHMQGPQAAPGKGPKGPKPQQEAA